MLTIVLGALLPANVVGECQHDGGLEVAEHVPVADRPAPARMFSSPGCNVGTSMPHVAAIAPLVVSTSHSQVIGLPQSAFLWHRIRCHHVPESIHRVRPALQQG